MAKIFLIVNQAICLVSIYEIQKFFQKCDQGHGIEVLWSGHGKVDLGGLINKKNLLLYLNERALLLLRSFTNNQNYLKNFFH
jgi:hypothetical protein